MCLFGKNPQSRNKLGEHGKLLDLFLHLGNRFGADAILFCQHFLLDLLSDLLEVEVAGDVIEAHDSAAICDDEHVVFGRILVLFAGVIPLEKAEVGLDSVVATELVRGRRVINKDLLGGVVTLLLVDLIEFQISQLGLRLQVQDALDFLIYRRSCFERLILVVFQVHFEVLVFLERLPVAFVLLLHKVDFSVPQLHILLSLVSEGHLLDSLGREVLVEEHLLSVLKLQSDIAHVFDHVLNHPDSFFQFGLFKLVEVKTELPFKEVEAVVDRDAEILLLCDLELGWRGHDEVPLFVGGGAVPDQNVDSADEGLRQGFEIIRFDRAVQTYFDLLHQSSLQCLE